MSGFHSAQSQSGDDPEDSVRARPMDVEPPTFAAGVAGSTTGQFHGPAETSIMLPEGVLL